ncbi:unnamed protein product, partial [Polarella glacialis]
MFSGRTTELAQEELQLLEAAALIYMYVTMPFKSLASAMLALASRLRANQRLPSSAEASKISWYQQMRHLRKRFSAEKQYKNLTIEELQQLEAVPLIYGFVTTPFKRGALRAISALVSWVQVNQRLPSHSSTVPPESSLYLRLKTLRHMLLGRTTELAQE